MPVPARTGRSGHGSVTFTAHDLVDPVAATRALNHAGITGRVFNETDPRGAGPCGSINPDDILGPVFKGGVGWKGADSITVRPRERVGGRDHGRQWIVVGCTRWSR
ncbi:MAG: hypothetical protein V7603_2481 [Micromonosporaceae bacterium]